MKAVLSALSLFVLAGSASAAEAPKPPAVTFAFEEVATLGPVQVVGETPNGRRQSIPITGGTFSGPGIQGRILPGGADYQLVRADGSVMIDADYMLETDDHTIIHVRNVGVIVRDAKGGLGYAWAAPTFNAPNGKYGWLNNALFVSSITSGGGGVKIAIFKLG